MPSLRLPIKPSRPLRHAADAEDAHPPIDLIVLKSLMPQGGNGYIVPAPRELDTQILNNSLFTTNDRIIELRQH
jgi:hypothetical protein